MGVYDFDLESYIGLARRLGTDTERVEVKAASQGLPKSMAGDAERVFEHVGWRGDSGARGASGVPRCSGLQGACCGRRACPDVRREDGAAVRASVEIVEFEGSPVVVATVPELPPELKPWLRQVARNA